MTLSVLVDLWMALDQHRRLNDFKRDVDYHRLAALMGHKLEPPTSAEFGLEVSAE